MLRDVVSNAFVGFQRTAVSSAELDERDLQVRRLRQEVRAMEGVTRQLLLEVAALRQELFALRAQGPAPAAQVPAPQAAPEVPAPQAAPEVPAPQAAPEVPAPQAAPEVPAPQAAPAAQAAPAPQPAPEAPAPSFAELAARAASGSLGGLRPADQTSTDLEGYRARMRANGREDVVLAGEGLNTAPDGEAFWGPVDNESSRARAKGRVLTIDQWECISCGTCVEQTADVFVLPDESKAEVIKQDGPMDLIQDAIDACPVTCINWIAPTELEDQHSAGGFKAGPG